MAFGLLADVKINGRENLPKQGPLIVVGNHFNFLDPLMFIHLLPYPVEFVGGAKMPNAPAATHFLQRLFGVIPTARGTVSRDTLYGAESILEQKGVLAIFPEGGSWATVLRPARPGAAFLAVRNAAPILPIGIDGTVGFFKNLRKGRVPVTLNIGKPFGPLNAQPGMRPSRDELDEVGHTIMRSIAPLIPPERRGFYSDDPSIREAARGTEIYPFASTAEI
ncbi:MAG TPA: lysophospholipid acyltransferase family protein [Anaerolineaceae bacterium]|nr:lysophospholipid acyltransferase family protein [Anaerolineaceae bacterium]